MIPAPPRTIPAELDGEQPQGQQHRDQADQHIAEPEQDADKQSHHRYEVLNENEAPCSPADAAEQARTNELTTEAANSACHCSYTRDAS